MTMSDSQRWLTLGVAVLGGWLLYLLGPVLTPFGIALLLAYMGDPLADRLEAYKLSRTASVVIVFVTIFTCILAAALLLVPMVESQLSALVRRIPGYVDIIKQKLLPYLNDTLGLEDGGEVLDAIKLATAAHWREAGGIAVGIVRTFTHSGAAMAAWIANLLLIPVVTFYLLRDWDQLVVRVHELVPETYKTRVAQVTKDCDEVIAEFFRGQILVMAGLSLIYAVGLGLVGLELALLIGLVAGIVSFVPYLGLFVGIALAGAAAYLQFQDWVPVVYVAVVFIVAQAIEGMLLTPLLVGDRIGLHPVAVIFAVLAGGQLFGFIGILLALPAAAVLAVLMRYAHERYIESELYRT